MPYLAEALYQSLRSQVKNPEKTLSVHLASWPSASSQQPAASSQQLLGSMAEVRRLASLGLAKRAEAKIKVRQPLASMLIANRESLIAKNEALLGILKDEVNVKEIIFDASIAEEVVLDTAITPALREEGLVREIARTVQELRQKAELEPGDRVALMMHVGDELRNAVMKNEATLKSDVGAKSIDYKKSEKFTAEIIAKIEGQEIWIGIRKT
jgi:isoleucyl-tRNA synthetase